jgi:exosortase A-associated hydrolase 2
MPSQAVDAFFHPAPGGGQRLYLHHAPPAGQAVRGALVYAHPWAEEMNKSRRMAALAARALAADGWAVLQVDLLGCGDSSGDFADATWQAWVQDIVAAAQWAQQRHPGAPLWLWGLRSGALLCTEAARTLGADTQLLLWQPALQGKQVLQQFLRLKAAAQLAQGGGKAALEAVRTDLAAGRHVQIAGYELGPLLASGLEAAQLAPPMAGPNTAAGRMRCLVWLEVSSQDPPTLTPAAQAALPRWAAAGWHTAASAVNGPAFWQTTEIETAPALISATRGALVAADAAAPARPTVAA